MSTKGNFEAYFDFDNTITSFDILDDIIQRFSVNEDWKQIEDDWIAGKIGSKECLERQFAQVSVSKAIFQDYLLSIRIDPAFLPILNLLRSEGIEPVVVSDSFQSIITTILVNNGVRDLQIFSNEMHWDGDRPVLSFPYFQSICSTCGNCKTSHLLRRNRPPGTRKIYVGDGKSDICPAGFCEILFAKGSLLKHYATTRPDCIAFENLNLVLSYLQNLLQ